MKAFLESIEAIDGDYVTETYNPKNRIMVNSGRILVRYSIENPIDDELRLDSSVQFTFARFKTEKQKEEMMKLVPGEIELNLPFKVI